MSLFPPENRRGNILVVDDNPLNLEMLVDMLVVLGHTALLASSGSEALDLARANPPDLILLDINMPVMNGYEVCFELKRDARLSTIPVIFLSGRADTIGITQAFSAGGVDYVTKPFFIPELNSRINTHLKLYFAQEELKEYANRLEDSVIERTKELRKAHERLMILDTTKLEFLDVIAHELKTPATSVLAVGQLAIMSLPNSKERQELMAIFEKGSQRLQRTLDNALLLAKLQTSDAEIISEHLIIEEILVEAIRNAEVQASEAGNEIVKLETCNLQVVGNSQFTEQCVATMLSVAIKMAEKGSKIFLNYRSDPEYVYLIFSTTGRTFPEESLDLLFDAFSYERISSWVEELGLSMPISAKIAALFGGKIEMQNTSNPTGIQILLTLKRV